MKNILSLVASLLLLSLSSPNAFSESLQESKSPEGSAVSILPGLGTPAPIWNVCQVGWNANDDYVSVAKNSSVTFSPLANDSDTVQQNFGGIMSPPQNGTAVQVGLDTVQYTPNAGFTGSDSFTYEHIGCYQCYGEGRTSWCSEPSVAYPTVYITVTN